MQLVMKFTQAYVNTHANELFSLSFWPVASAGGIWDLKLCPARIRMPEVDTEKEKDPFFHGDHEYQERAGQKMQVTYFSDSVRCSRAHAPGKWWSYLRKLKAKWCKWSGTRKPPYSLRERPEICSWPCKPSGKRNWWGVPKSIWCDLSWQPHRGSVWRSGCGPSSDFLLTNPSSPWAGEGGQNSGGSGAVKAQGNHLAALKHTKPPQTSPETGTQCPSSSIKNWSHFPTEMGK